SILEPGSRIHGGPPSMIASSGYHPLQENTLSHTIPSFGSSWETPGLGQRWETLVPTVGGAGGGSLGVPGDPLPARDHQGYLSPRPGVGNNVRTCLSQDPAGIRFLYHEEGSRGDGFRSP